MFWSRLGNDVDKQNSSIEMVRIENADDGERMRIAHIVSHYDLTPNAIV